FSFPLDAGTIFFDGRPLFGPSKTIRGILISVLITIASAPLIGLDLTIGAIVAGAAMAGDLFSSFVKRRLNSPPSSQALGLDQVPESLFPMLACRDALSLTLIVQKEPADSAGQPQLRYMRRLTDEAVRLLDDLRSGKLENQANFILSECFREAASAFSMINQQLKRDGYAASIDPSIFIWLAN